MAALCLLALIPISTHVIKSPFGRMDMGPVFCADHIHSHTNFDRPGLGSKRSPRHYHGLPHQLPGSHLHTSTESGRP